MHEQSLTEHIVQIAMEYALALQTLQDTDLYLVIGVRCPRKGKTIQIQWDIVKRGPLAEEARRHFYEAYFKLKCIECGSTFDVVESAPICPECGGVSVSVVEAEGHCFENIKGEQT